MQASAAASSVERRMAFVDGTDCEPGTCTVLETEFTLSTIREAASWRDFVREKAPSTQ